MNNKSVLLINSSYDADNAKALIAELLAFKINYLNLKKFSEEERQGKVSQNVAERIIALGQTKNELSQWFEQLQGNPKLHLSLDLKIETL